MNVNGNFDNGVHSLWNIAAHKNIDMDFVRSDHQYFDLCCKIKRKNPGSSLEFAGLDSVLSVFIIPIKLITLLAIRSQISGTRRSV